MGGSPSEWHNSRAVMNSTYPTPCQLCRGASAVLRRELRIEIRLRAVPCRMSYASIPSTCIQCAFAGDPATSGERRRQATTHRHHEGGRVRCHQGGSRDETAVRCGFDACRQWLV